MSDDTKKPFTKDDWPAHFARLAYDSAMLLGYMLAVRLSIPALKNIAEIPDEKAKATALHDFIEAQRDLLEDIDEKWYGDDHDLYGLPELRGPE